MNAYETPLVELLKTVPKDARFVEEKEFSSTYHPVGRLCHEAADRIAELEKINDCYKKLEEASKIASKPLSQKYREPVAWAIKSDGDFTEIGWDNEVLHEVEEWYTAQGWQYEYLPLYTTPQTKPLSDEEICNLWIEHSYGVPLSNISFEFARAIEERHGIK